MYLSDYRAVDYLSQRPDWDGKTLIVKGTSMGGQQSIVTAALQSEKVTEVSVMVPSSCDATAPKVGRAAGFPDWAAQAQSKNNDKILETSRYFDPMNFASRIKCPAQVAMGFLDTTSPPAGVFAMLNQIKGPVEVVPMIHSGHQDMPPGVQKPYTDRNTIWLKTIAAGQAPPVDLSLAKP
jgi:cephalosporin-C deacetylase-like acetyl esterase